MFFLFFLIIFIIICIVAALSDNVKPLPEKTYNRKEINTLLIEIDSMSGKEFEVFLARLFKIKGCSVTITPNTNDYGADIIAEKNGINVAVQAKRSKRKIGIRAVQDISSGMQYYKTNYAVVITNNYFTNNAIGLARKTSVIIYNRDDLRKYILYRDLQFDEIKLLEEVAANNSIRF